MERRKFVHSPFKPLANSPADQTTTCLGFDIRATVITKLCTNVYRGTLQLRYSTFGKGEPEKSADFGPVRPVAVHHSERLSDQHYLSWVLPRKHPLTCQAPSAAPYSPRFVRFHGRRACTLHVPEVSFFLPSPGSQPRSPTYLRSVALTLLCATGFGSFNHAATMHGKIKAERTVRWKSKYPTRFA